MGFSIKKEPRKPAPLPRPEPKDLHSKLCEIGRKWVLRAPSAKGGNMHLSFTEIGCNKTKEHPDVFGLHSSGETIILEAKASRSDFLADKKKSFRANPDQGMGDFRYYISPKDVIKESDLDGTQWGLIWVSPGGNCKVLRGHCLHRSYHGREENDLKWRCKKNKEAENDLILSLLIRTGFNVDLSALIENMKVEAKYQHALMNSKDPALVYRRIERANLIEEFSAVIKGNDYNKCPHCAERQARDSKQLMRKLKRMNKDQQ
ncbi:coil containing protein [Vibrio phage 1.215.B._10N.222.54.F7]|nr:coil containing protein [Vibrio phage 1.215.A._10N.222.54.F7]AUR96089.1 coil containing protein [Vibrio phage 1.215.B._10N.222.54.F7]